MTHLEDEIAEINSSIKKLKKAKRQLQDEERKEARRKRRAIKRGFTRG